MAECQCLSQVVPELESMPSKSRLPNQTIGFDLNSQAMVGTKQQAIESRKQITKPNR